MNNNLNAINYYLDGEGYEFSDSEVGQMLTKWGLSESMENSNPFDADQWAELIIVKISSDSK